MSEGRIRLVTTLAGIAVSQAAGLAGLVLMGSGLREWYPKLHKPSFNPPSWVFGPTWTSLYTLMGIAVSIVWRRPADQARSAALGFFGIHLTLNALWTGAFFGLRSTLAGLVGIVALWLAILGTITSFARVSRTAAGLLTPYLAWVSFATVLNFAIWRRNR